LGVAQPGRRAAAQGGGAGVGTPPPQRILRSCWAGEGLWAYQEGQMGQKMVRFAELCGTRSRQDAPIEVHQAGRIRPSSGGNGGHVLSMYPLIWRSLRCGEARLPHLTRCMPRKALAGGLPASGTSIARVRCSTKPNSNCELRFVAKLGSVVQYYQPPRLVNAVSLRFGNPGTWRWKQWNPRSCRWC
jgi:hypothetical protein